MLDIRRNLESSDAEPRNLPSPNIPDFLDNYKEKGREQNCELRIADCGFRSKKSGVRIQNPGGKKIRSALQFWLLATDYLNFYDLNVLNDFNGFNDLPLTAYCLPLTVGHWMMD